MQFQLITVLLGLSFPQAHGPNLFYDASSLAGPSTLSAVRVAGLCIGSAQDCLREAISDGELSSDEAALPYEVLVTFTHNSAELSAEAQAELRELAIVLNDSLLATRKFLIEGHTDAIGSEIYNQTLSERRALAVRDFLGTLGVEPSRLSSLGLGESRPRVSDPRAPENRRVELKIAP